MSWPRPKLVKSIYKHRRSNPHRHTRRRVHIFTFPSDAVSMSSKAISSIAFGGDHTPTRVHTDTRKRQPKIFYRRFFLRHCECSAFSATNYAPAFRPFMYSALVFTNVRRCLNPLLRYRQIVRNPSRCQPHQATEPLDTTASVDLFKVDTHNALSTRASSRCSKQRDSIGKRKRKEEKSRQRSARTQIAENQCERWRIVFASL